MKNKAFVINANSSPERWASLQTQLCHLSLPVERVEAVMGSQLTAEELRYWYSPSKNKRQFHVPLLAGEIGCYASHATVWQRMLAEQLDWALILEDDALIASDIDASLAVLLKHIDLTVVDMVKLRGRAEEKVGRVLPISGELQVVCYERVPSCTTGYILTAGGARKLLVHSPSFGRPVDLDICQWWDFDLRIVGLKPYPIQSNHAHASMIGQRTDIGAWARLKRMGLCLVFKHHTRRALAQQD